MPVKTILMGVIGLCFGLLVSGGVLTVFVTVGLIPRFAQKSGTARKMIAYENAVILGTIGGTLLTIYPQIFCLHKWFLALQEKLWLMKLAENIALSVYGLFAGLFFGCFAIAIAEMLNSVPIFGRRVGFHNEIPFFVLSIALGKGWGSFLFFYLGIFTQP